MVGGNLRGVYMQTLLWWRENDEERVVGLGPRLPVVPWVPTIWMGIIRVSNDRSEWS